MEKDPKNTVNTLHLKINPKKTTDKIIYLSLNTSNDCIYIQGSSQKCNIKNVLKINRKTLHISKVMYLSPECEHVFTFIGLLGIFDVHGSYFLVGISQAEEFKIGWAKIYKIFRLKVIEISTLVENENYSGLLNSYFTKGFFFSYDLDLTALNGICN
jgi:hypothetical protein